MTNIIDMQPNPSGYRIIADVEIDDNLYTVTAEYEPPERGQRTLAEGQLQPDLAGTLIINRLQNYNGKHIHHMLDNDALRERIENILWHDLGLRRHPK